VITNKQLNRLATSAKLGCPEAKDELLRHYIPIIERLSKSIWYYIEDTDAFETYCYKRLEDAIKRFDPSRGSFSWQMQFRLRQAKSHFLKNRGRKLKQIQSLDDLGEVSDSKTKRKEYFEPIDDLAVVEDELLVKEKIALLAKGDSRKKAILLAWSDGFYNDSALSELLAQLFGGKPESHRQAIKRFRSFCQASLAEIA
jgi:DNA-directed RNA polymerase specialized sigma subunit